MSLPSHQSSFSHAFQFGRIHKFITIAGYFPIVGIIPGSLRIAHTVINRKSLTKGEIFGACLRASLEVTAGPFIAIGHLIQRITTVVKKIFFSPNPQEKSDNNPILNIEIEKSESEKLLEQGIPINDEGFFDTKNIKNIYKLKDAINTKIREDRKILIKKDLGDDLVKKLTQVVQLYECDDDPDNDKVELKGGNFKIANKKFSEPRLYISICNAIYLKYRGNKKNGIQDEITEDYIKSFFLASKN